MEVTRGPTGDISYLTRLVAFPCPWRLEGLEGLEAWSPCCRLGLSRSRPASTATHILRKTHASTVHCPLSFCRLCSTHVFVPRQNLDSFLTLTLASRACRRPTWHPPARLSPVTTESTHRLRATTATVRTPYYVPDTSEPSILRRIQTRSSPPPPKPANVYTSSPLLPTTSPSFCRPHYPSLYRPLPGPRCRPVPRKHSRSLAHFPTKPLLNSSPTPEL